MGQFGKAVYLAVNSVVDVRFRAAEDELPVHPAGSGRNDFSLGFDK